MNPINCAQPVLKTQEKSEAVAQSPRALNCGSHRGRLFLFTHCLHCVTERLSGMNGIVAYNSSPPPGLELMNNAYYQLAIASHDSEVRTVEDCEILGCDFIT